VDAQAAAGRGTQRFLVTSLMFIALVVAVVGSLGAPLITSVSAGYRVPLSSAQWTLTITLLAGAIATPVLGRLGSGRRRRAVIRWALVVIVAGSVATVLPLPFGWLLAGRAAQGTALGLTALMMGVARDHVPGEKSAPVIAMLSVASTVGIGLGYPLAGLLTDAGGVRAAYGLGLFITVLALLAAWRAIPPSPPGRPGDLDVPGAVLLGGGLLALLIPVSQSGLWTSAPWAAALLLAVAAGLLAGWAWWEHRAAAPLTDLGLLRHPAVAGANLAMFAGGIGMYLLLTLVTRYVQTPAGTGYGFGFSVFVAGLVLVPFSVLGFVGGRVAPALRSRVPLTAILAAGAAVVLAALLIFALARSRAWESFVVMGALGLGVGTFSAAMPGVILTVTPAGETSSAMSFNQVVRSVGFSIGSALSGFILSACTPHGGHGRAFPASGGYGTAAWAGVAAMAVTLAVIAGLAGRGRRQKMERKPDRLSGYAPGGSR
jgi:predicted MFS family arabinose efflux permease